MANVLLLQGHLPCRLMFKRSPPSQQRSMEAYTRQDARVIRNEMYRGIFLLYRYLLAVSWQASRQPPNGRVPPHPYHVHRYNGYVLHMAHAPYVRRKHRLAWSAELGTDRCRPSKAPTNLNSDTKGQPCRACHWVEPLGFRSVCSGRAELRDDRLGESALFRRRRRSGRTGVFPAVRG